MENDRQRIDVAKLEDRLTAIKILASNGYSTRIVTCKTDGKKITCVEYWKET